MKQFFLGILLCFWSVALHAQYTFRVLIINADEQTPLPAATVTWKEGGRSVAADSSGIATVTGITNGRQTFLISYVGFRARAISYSFPLAHEAPVEIALEKEEGEEEVIVSATRISRTITNTPTRIEVISGEELVEKGNMKPGDIRMLLNESTGIQTQQTSATSFNAGIRIQGLDGRYTQILRDGYPLYAGFSGGLSILQIAPLDLRQVEVIKGSASTLYGGGAIAGLVNLVSKTPGPEREISFVANATSARGLDLSGFYSERYGKAGLTVFASRNSNAAFDPAGIGLTAIPKFERYSINPRLFLYRGNTTADIGISVVKENRIGGSLDYIKNGGTGFFERNNTARITAQAGVVHRFNERSAVQLKNSYSRFDRSITLPAYSFEALQQSSYSELSWIKKVENHDVVIGANLVTDNLFEDPQTLTPVRDYRFITYGLFVQNSWSPTDRFTLETGLRGDYVKAYGWEFLPRASAMLRLSQRLTTRLGGGFGYKTPTVFTEESERIQFQNLLPIDPYRSRNERSLGSNWDVNYKTTIGAVGFSFNHLFFYTRLNRPLVLTGAGGGKVEFQNATGYLDSKGMETNLRFVHSNFKLFVGYTYTDASTHYSGTGQWLSLTARHRLNNVLMFEIEDKIKIGLEGYYFSPQRLNDGSLGRPYWITGLMAEKLWEHLSLFINFENFTDTRQSKWGSIYSGSVNNPVFKDIYAPVEGFVVNGGVKIRL